jgi:bifunctional non-homologous end joining protein LigD
MAKGKLSDKEKLRDYSAKRAFGVTPEPVAAVPAARRGPLLFVIQQHSARRMHYDFRLECDGVLKSWAVPKGPSLDPAEKRLAVPTEDHPFDYASFEGVIPPGQYGAGEVIVWDCGVYSPDEVEPWVDDRAEAEKQVREGLHNGKLSVLLRGEKVKGSFALVRTSRGKDWLLIKHKDRFVSTDDITARSRSVLSGIAVDEMKAMPVQRIAAANLVPAGNEEPMPEDLEPMQAELADAPFNKADWMWEPKLDGYRLLAFIRKTKVSLRSRRGLELARQFPGLAMELAKQGPSMILDGEIVAFDPSGKTSFNALQNRFQLKTERDIAAAEKSTPVVLYAFDLLHFAGVDLRKAAYLDRRRYLAQCLLPSSLVQLVHASDDGVELYAAALASGFEGVIGKRKQSRYESGRRSTSWLKVKSTRSADFVVGGYTKGKGGRAALGALLVGYWDGKNLRYASHVGSGFDDLSLPLVRARLEALERRTCPFADKPEMNAPTTWVEPKAVVEVKFQGWTGDGSLRAPVFLRLRDDIDARSVRRDAQGTIQPKTSSEPEIDDVLRQLERIKANGAISIGPHTIKLSSLDRVYWPADAALKQPALTKRDLLRYLAQVSPFMLPHLADRPLTMIRMPDGIRGQRFYQKHWAQERPPFVDTITVFSEHKDESHDYLLCNNLPTLLWLAQSGTLEFHVWHSRARPGSDSPVASTDYSSSLGALESSILNYPDYVVFDIDPYIYSGKEAPGEEPELNTVAFQKGKEVAFKLRELLNTMSLEPIVKTSGKTGLHVFLPIRRTIDFDIAREVSEQVGRHLMRLAPKDVTLEWSVPKRTGKIFMDYNMNVRGKTLNVAYSPRGAVGAPVSMPLTWDELAGAHPLDFRITNAAGFVTPSGDRWRNVLQKKQSLEATLERAKA